MDNLHIEKSKYTMGIDFNQETGILEMNGSSYPENALDFFNPIIRWVKDYIAHIKKPINMNIRLNYLNTSSTKCILDILEILDQYHQSGGQVKINWYYKAGDEDIKETGQELAEDFHFPISFISY
ncbi:MAG: DUF1987 domain-containing protein [bacterium]|nr:DUF1987 domain-containing protein [bacterium]